MVVVVVVGLTRVGHAHQARLRVLDVEVFVAELAAVDRDRTTCVCVELCQ